MAKEGWVKLHRCLLDKPIWKCSTAEQKVILITLLSIVNHDEEEWIWQGKKFNCKAGQKITSIESIAKESGTSIQNVRTALVKFEKLGFLTNQSTKTGRLITITNWGFYQADKEKVTKELTKSQQRPNKDLTTNKNDKNDKNDKKCIYIRENTNSYGEFHNVFLTNSEYENLKQYNDYKKLIEEVSIWLCDHTQNNHYATCKKFIKNNGYTKKNISEPIKPSGKSEPMPDEIRTKLNDLFGG